jgi:hypothetical protein
VEPKTKEAYEAPELVVISLEAEQVLAVGCKVISTPQQNVGGFPQCGIPQSCIRNGS